MAPPGQHWGSPGLSCRGTWLPQKDDKAGQGHRRWQPAGHLWPPPSPEPREANNPRLCLLQERRPPGQGSPGHPSFSTKGSQGLWVGDVDRGVSAMLPETGRRSELRPNPRPPFSPRRLALPCRPREARPLQITDHSSRLGCVALGTPLSLAGLLFSSSATESQARGFQESGHWLLPHRKQMASPNHACRTQGPPLLQKHLGMCFMLCSK